MSSVRLRRQTVLIVEDHAMLRGILAESLADEGYAVLTAEDGEQALAIAGTLEGRLGLVITDVLLPVMDGVELAARLACLKSPPPVLFISGVTTTRSVPGPMLAKPFGPAAFLEQVARMLPGVQHH
jgi:two-component system, cell cycle sensor histidine kinase and response regulator CckA